MGSGASAATSETPGGDLRLPTTGLRFTASQLRALNSYVDSLYEQDQMGRMSMELESSVESLVQRIVDGAGQRDPRFRCCHLVALHRGKKMRSRSLEYLVTLDSLPVLKADQEFSLQEGPTGYGKIRLGGKLAELWEEFLTPGGYLCRDKVLERWVELLARCAHARGGGGSRVLCAKAAAHAMPYRYCYLERVSPPQISTETRLAIVEGSAWVMVRVGAGEAEAKLVLGVRGNGCCAAQRPCPLVHPLALLHYTAAQSGFYAVTVGPPSSVVCAERQATWQLRHPALEAALDAHCADQSTVSRIAGAVNALIDRMRDGVAQGSIRVLSRYSAWCALRHRLDGCGALTSAAARACLAVHASHHFLLVIDALISVCEREAPTGYVYSLGRANCTRRGLRASGADWMADGHCLRRLLLHAHADSTAAESIPPTISESLETVMFGRWENLLRESRAAAGSPPVFSRRQLKYVWRLATELIKCKQAVIVENHSAFRANLIQATSLQHQPIEDLIHILAIILDQARDLYLYSNFSQPRTNEFDRNLFTYRSKKWGKLRDYYDASSACLIDAVRRDPQFRQQDLSDEITMMRNIINWLYKGAKDDKKYLAPVLKPYLDSLFNSSLENSWFLEDFDGSKCSREFEGLEEYCMKVHEGTLDPCSGLLRASRKLAWAKAMVDFVDRARHVDLRLVFPTGDGMAVSYPVGLPSRRDRASRSLTLNRNEKADAKITLARRCVVSAFNNALTCDTIPKQRHINRHGSTDEIISSMKSGHYWRNNTKPDIIPSSSEQDNLPRVVRRKSRRSRPATAYGFPEISITSQNPKTLRKKYHTLRSLVYTEAAEDVKDMKERPRSAGSTMRSKEAISRPSILETLDFINGVKDALCADESASDTEQRAWGPTDDWALGQVAALNVVARLAAGGGVHLTLGSIVVALLSRGKFTILQELCAWLGDSSEGALFALHRLARAARSRSSERSTSSWKLPEASTDLPEPTQRYKARHPDYVSGDEAPQPPPLPRRSRQVSEKRYTDYLPPKRLQELEDHIKSLEIINSKLSLDIPRTSPLNENYTGIINPIYDVRKIPKDKFNSTKRSKSLGRTFSTKRLGLEVTRYNITLGHKHGQKTNDVVTAITGMTGESGLDTKSNIFQRYSSTASVVGDSYRVSRVTID